MSFRTLDNLTISTWNPSTGCTKISAGCKHCYAERIAKRLQLSGSPNYADGFHLTLHEHVLTYPLRWRRPRDILVNSMSDLFHEQMDDVFIMKVFGVMRQAYWHRFRVLTKRSRRLADFSARIVWPKNVWVGVTVENQEAKSRIEDLRQVYAPARFLSVEPMLESLVPLDLTGVDWVIAGAESGKNARVTEAIWVNDLRDHCLAQGVSFSFKQRGWPDENSEQSIDNINYGQLSLF